MAIITWIDEYNINIKMIDEQHQHLVTLINKMYGIVSSDDNVKKSQIRRLFAELADYTNYHFRAEEELLKMHNYPEFKSHKQRHDRLAMHLLELQMSFVRGETISVALLDFLNDWLINHILGSDKKYASFIQSQQIF